MRAFPPFRRWIPVARLTTALWMEGPLPDLAFGVTAKLFGLANEGVEIGLARRTLVNHSAASRCKRRENAAVNAQRIVGTVRRFSFAGVASAGVGGREQRP